MTCFPPDQRALFAAGYPELPHKLEHCLHAHPLLELEALAALGEALPAASVEYNAADQPLGIASKPQPTGIPIGKAIREIEKSGSWAVLKNVEQDPGYAALIESLLAELRPAIEARTGRMLKTQGFVFISSPLAVTPYHFDPEHNVLLQLRGTKSMTQFPAGDADLRARRDPRKLSHRRRARTGLAQRIAGRRHHFTLSPGEALFVPVMAPHFVRNGPEPSVSLSITWRSEWSFAEADARALNAAMRKIGHAAPQARPLARAQHRQGLWLAVCAAGWPPEVCRGRPNPLRISVTISQIAMNSAAMIGPMIKPPRPNSSSPATVAISTTKSGNLVSLPTRMGRSRLSIMPMMNRPQNTSISPSPIEPVTSR